VARVIGPITQLTSGEELLLKFLFENKGKEFTAQEIEEETGIRAIYVEHVMDVLMWKGFEVGSQNGKHFFIHNTWKSYLVGGGIVAAMGLIFLFGWLDIIG
jgi:hypothetical protein